MTLVGGIVAVTGAVGAAQNNARAAAEKANKAKLDKAIKRTFPTALSSCNLADGPDSQLGDGGYTLTINNQGDSDFSGISFEGLGCLIDKLNTPSSVKSHIEQTTSLDGRQSETWGNITMSWSYHPDRGLDAVYQIKH
jgi:hypothetical protein